MKNNSRGLALLALALLTLASSGCSIMTSYALRPTQWAVHNAFPSTCKTCPGGMPGPDGCRSFVDPWCAGYQTTMWRELGVDCGPARLPSALAFSDRRQPTPADEMGADEGDAPPDLPSSIPSPLPTPGQLPTPLPELPFDGAPLDDDPFPVRPVPSSPADDPQNIPLREPDGDAPPVAPDLFPEARPGGAKKPAGSPPVETPENIEDLFAPPSGSPPGTKSPSALPPTQTPVTPLPNLNDNTAPKPKEVLPAPKTNAPFSETPSVEDIPNLFPEEKKPATAPKKSTPLPKAPNLFDDSSWEQPSQQPTSYATLRFGAVLPVSHAEAEAESRPEASRVPPPASETWQLRPASESPATPSASPPPVWLRFLQR